MGKALEAKSGDVNYSFYIFTVHLSDVGQSTNIF